MTEKKYTNAWDLRERTKFCVDCKWGDFHASLGLPASRGLCRRHPPLPGWVSVMQHDWCSEFVESDKARAEEKEIHDENL